MTRIEEYLSSTSKKLGEASPEVLDDLSKKFDKVALETIMEYNLAQYDALQKGLISVEESMWIYHRLGGNCPSKESWDILPLADKIVITVIMSDIANLGC